MTSEDNEVAQGSAVTTEFRREIRRQAVEQVAKWTIVTLGMLSLIAFSGWILYLEPILKARLGVVPAGAVVAFDISDGCPVYFGWTPFLDVQGKVIVGTGQGSGTTPRPFRHTGGQESFILSAGNIPEHQHDVQLGVLSAGDTNWGAGYKKKAISGANIQDNLTALSGPYGQKAPEAVPTMPPFISLVYCKKT